MVERNKGGRPSGAAWANKRSAGVRKHAQRNRIEILDTRDPLAELIRLGFEGETEELRVKALIGAIPFLYPRLSMQTVEVADTHRNPQAEIEALREKLLGVVLRLPQASDAIEVQVDPQTPSEDGGVG